MLGAEAVVETWEVLVVVVAMVDNRRIVMAVQVEVVEMEESIRDFLRVVEATVRMGIFCSRLSH